MHLHTEINHPESAVLPHGQNSTAACAMPKLMEFGPAIASPIEDAKDGGSERRRERRLPTDESALLQLLNPLSEGRLVIRVLDVSKNGLKLITPIQLHRGALVQVYLKGVIALGEIRYCTQTSDAEYCAGIQLSDTLPCRSDDETWEA